VTRERFVSQPAARWSCWLSGKPVWSSTTRVPASAGSSSKRAIEYTPSSQLAARHACTMRRAGTSSSSPPRSTLGASVTDVATWRWPFARDVDYFVYALLSRGAGAPGLLLFNQ
jgi:hypothetical protein